MDVPEQKTIYLWGLPRSLSTAVLRAMVTVDGCLVSVEVTLQLPGECQPIQDEVSANPQNDITKLFLSLRLRLGLIGRLVILPFTISLI